MLVKGPIQYGKWGQYSFTIKGPIQCDSKGDQYSVIVKGSNTVL